MVDGGPGKPGPPFALWGQAAARRALVGDRWGGRLWIAGCPRYSPRLPVNVLRAVGDCAVAESGTSRKSRRITEGTSRAGRDERQ